jgi:hypothetical protein
MSTEKHRHLFQRLTEVINSNLIIQWRPVERSLLHQCFKQGSNFPVELENFAIQCSKNHLLEIRGINHHLHLIFNCVARCPNLATLINRYQRFVVVQRDVTVTSIHNLNSVHPDTALLNFDNIYRDFSANIDQREYASFMNSRNLTQ